MLKKTIYKDNIINYISNIMSIFEITMLTCFGAAWPLSIWKSIKSKSTSGKSLPFMIIIAIGYIAGMLHKIVYNFDLVFYLYLLNFLMVGTDVTLYFVNKYREKKLQNKLN
jgi:hypothetical protein